MYSIMQMAVSEIVVLFFQFGPIWVQDRVFFWIEPRGQHDVVLVSSTEQKTVQQY